MFFKALLLKLLSLLLICLFTSRGKKICWPRNINQQTWHLICPLPVHLSLKKANNNENRLKTSYIKFYAIFLFQDLSFSKHFSHRQNQLKVKTDYLPWRLCIWMAKVHKIREGREGHGDRYSTAILTFHPWASTSVSLHSTYSKILASSVKI